MLLLLPHGLLLQQHLLERLLPLHGLLLQQHLLEGRLLLHGLQRSHHNRIQALPLVRSAH
jgi:hypothetical protein